MPVGFPKHQNPYGRPPPFFDPETEEPYGYGVPQPAPQTPAPPELMGFLDVAGGVGYGAPDQEPPQLIEPLAQQEAPQLDGGGMFGGDAPAGDYPTETSIERRQRLAKVLMGQQQEVNHPMQAIGNAVSQITSAWMEGKAAREQEAMEKRRLDEYKKALSGGQKDLLQLAKQLQQSNDRVLVEKGLEIEIGLMTRGRDARKPPPIRSYERGGEKVTEQWNEDTGQFEPLATAPRYREGGGGGGEYRSQKGDWVLLPDGRKKFAEYVPNRGLVYREDDGAIKQVPDGATPITASQGGFLDQKNFNKVVKEFQDDDNALSRLNGYFTRVKNTNLGWRRWSDGVSANVKTFLASGKVKPRYTQEEIDLMSARGELQGLLGLFRTDIVGPGVMTEYDAARVIMALGGDVTLLQNPAVVEERLKDLYEQKKRSRDRNVAIIEYNRAAYPGLVTPTARAPDELTETRDSVGQSQAPKYKDGDARIINGKRFVRRNGHWYEELKNERF